MFHIKAEKLSKRFGGIKVFKNLEFNLSTGESMAVVGPNGSGKSTLLQVMMGTFTATKGKVSYYNDDKLMDDDQVRAGISLVSPYLNLYDQLSAEENLKFFTTVAGNNVTGKEIESLLEKVGLSGRGMDLVGTYSSGMKQRLKYAVAIVKNPAFLFLDEPTSNLDEDGKKIVFDIVEEFRKKSIVIVATNEKEEYSLAQKQLWVNR